MTEYRDRDERTGIDYSLVAIGAFLMNLAWEMSQSFLFATHFSGVRDFIVIHLMASLADVAISFGILAPELFLFDRFFSENMEWLRSALTAMVGFLIAVMIERYALAIGMWAYGPYMPIIPVFGVGLTPVLQMMIVPSVSFRAFGLGRGRKEKTA